MKTFSLPETVGHVLWLVPKGNAARVLGSWIETLATRLRGPVFEPHVTLLGSPLEDGPEIRETLREIGRSSKRFTVSTRGAGIEEHPFRALFLPVPMTGGLWSLRQNVREVLAPEESNHYLPHVSLYYGSAPLAERVSALAELKLPPEVTFEAEEIQLMEVNGGPEDWHSVATFPLLPPEAAGGESS